LLDDRTRQAQLLRLERRTGRSGKDSIDHPLGSHDDIANARAGALAAAAGPVDCSMPTAIHLAPEPHRGVDWDAMRRDPFLGVGGRLRDGFSEGNACWSGLCP
jgi:hypothetical protein